MDPEGPPIRQSQQQRVWGLFFLTPSGFGILMVACAAVVDEPSRVVSIRHLQALRDVLMTTPLLRRKFWPGAFGHGLQG